jgi:hypothetical protein
VSDGLQATVIEAVTGAHGSTIQAIEELLKPLEARYAAVFEMYSGLCKVKTTARKHGYEWTASGIEAAIVPLKAQKETLSATIKTLRVRRRVLQFIKFHLGEVFTYQDWYLTLSALLDETGDLGELRIQVGNSERLQRELGDTFDPDADAKRRAKLAELEAKAAKNSKPDLDAALLFLASHGVLVYSSAESGNKVVLPDLLPE